MMAVAPLPCRLVSSRGPLWPAATDERPHPPPPSHVDWEESWHFDAVAPEGALAVSVRVTLRPADGRAWWWAHVVRPGHPVVAVRDHDLDPPRGRALELRGPGLWVDVTCEEPLDHWSVGLEALGVAFDDPLEAWRDERGDPTPVGLDVGWESAGPVCARPEQDGYAQPMAVHGEVLVGRERLDLDATGWRTHTWGVRDWWGSPWWWAGAHLDDDSALCASSGDSSRASHPQGGVSAQRTGGGPVMSADRDQHGRVRSASLTVGDETFDVTPVLPAPVAVTGPGERVTRLDRAACSFRSSAGRGGWGWAEWSEPTRRRPVSRLR